jgi:hypothetical protein
MATYNTTKSSSAALYAMPGIGDGQSLKCMSASYAVTAGTALALNDVIQSPLIQAGSVIVDVTVVVSDLDTSTGITLDVGYGVDPDYFVAASTTGQTGGVIRANAVTARPLVLTTNDTVDVLVKTAATGTAATTFTVDIIVYFLALNS